MSNDRLWLDEEFRRQYPLTAQRLQDLNEQEQADLADRQYRRVLQELHAAAGLSEKELLKLGAEGLHPSFTDETLSEKERQRNSPEPPYETEENEKNDSSILKRLEASTKHLSGGARMAANETSDRSNGESGLNRYTRS